MGVAGMRFLKTAQDKIRNISWGQPLVTIKNVFKKEKNINSEDYLSEQYSMPESHDPSLASIMQHIRKGLFIIAAFSLFVNGLMLVIPIYSLQLFDRVLSSRSYDTLYLLTIVAIGLLAVQNLIDALRGRILTRLGLHLEDKLKGSVLGATLQRAALGETGSAQGLRDLTELRQSLTSPATYALFDAPWIPVFLLVLFLLHPWLGGLAVIGLILLTVLASLNVILSRASHDKANETAIQTFEAVQHYVRNAEAIQAMGMLQNVVRKWSAKASDVLFLNAIGADQHTLIATLTKFLRMLLQIGVMGVGVGLVLNNELTPGGMIAASILLGRTLQPLEQAVGAWKGWANAAAAYRRLQEKLSMLPKPSSPVPLPTPEGFLSVRRLSYSLIGLKKPIVRGVEFHLKPGEIVGVIGPSGSGKSTLARLLVGILPPTMGEVLLDGASVFDWNREEMGQYIGYLPQDIQLFPGTVRDNIARLQEGFGEEVLEAAKKARVHDLILNLPDGYETNIGPGGVKLSGGQEQRIALARALFRNPKLIVLDEPDSHLDPPGHDALLKVLIQCQKSGQTVLMITHRPGVLSRVERLIVVREGMIERDGPREEILAAMRSAAQQGTKPSGKTSKTEEKTP